MSAVYVERYLQIGATTPYPVNKDPNALCCDACNMGIVVPVRMMAMSAKKGEQL